MKKLFKLVVFLLAMVMISGCGLNYKIVKKDVIEPEVTTKEELIKTVKQDLIAKAINNKENSLLQSILADMLNGGEILKRTVNGKWHGPVEIAKEEWIITGSGGKHLITWKNGILTDIDEYKEVKEPSKKPMGFKE